MVTRAIAPTSRRRARFLSCNSSSLIDFAMAVRNLCLTLAFADYRGNRKKGSENNDFIIIGGRFTGGVPGARHIGKLLGGRAHPRVRQRRRDLYGARAARAAGGGHEPL